MKRTLAAMLTALMLLTFLPFASPPAKAYDFDISASLDSAFVGETIFWHLVPLPGDFSYAFDVYEYIGGCVAPEGYHKHSFRYYTFHSPGIYYVKVYAYDNATDEIYLSFRILH